MRLKEKRSSSNLFLNIHQNLIISARRFRDYSFSRQLTAGVCSRGEYVGFVERKREEIKTIGHRKTAWKPKEVSPGRARGIAGGVEGSLDPLMARLIFHKFEKHTRGSRCVNLNFSVATAKAPARRDCSSRVGAAWKSH